MVRDENGTTPAWPQVQWDAIGQPDADPEEHGAAAHEVYDEPAPLEPDGYVYDAQGYAHPVYGGYVYDAEGNAYPVESLVTAPPAHDAVGGAGGAGHTPVPQAPAADGAFDRFAAVDPTAQWGFGEDEAPSSRSARRRGSNDRRGRSAIALLVSLALVVAAGFAVMRFLGPIFDQEPSVTAGPEDFPGPGSGSVEVVVSPGDTGAAIGSTLAEAGVVASVSAFTSAYAANPDSVGIQHGTYSMLLEMNAADAVERLLDTGNKIELRVTIAEGRTVEQILKTASSKTQISLEDFEAAAASPRDLGVPEGADDQLEGWLFPATYTVEPGDTAEDLLKAMVAQTRKVLSSLDVPEDEWEVVLNKAALVEREINRDEDRGKAARVIENRLEKNMTLGIDATLAYGLDKSGFELTVSELNSDHPYNTRTQPGLPPTPIGSPGRKAIEAVLNPEEGSWEYWVTINPTTGETVFSETYAEHNEHKKLFEEWLRENSGNDG